MNKKKAQTEMIGLAIIVMIMLVAMIFAVKFMIKAPEVKSELSDKQIGIAMLNTILSDKLEVDDCKGGVELKELIQDCAATAGLENKCSDDSTTYCDKAKEVAKELFENSFGTRKKPYQFKLVQVDLHDRACIDAPRRTMIDIPETGNPCSGDKVLVNYPLPTDYGTIFACLNICN